MTDNQKKKSLETYVPPPPKAAVKIAGWIVGLALVLYAIAAFLLPQVDSILEWWGARSWGSEEATTDCRTEYDQHQNLGRWEQCERERLGWPTK